jgi:hypothetical protein
MYNSDPCHIIPLPTSPSLNLLAIPLSLAIGSPLSSLSLTVSKITAINAKHGPFDACVLVGDVFKEGSDGSEIGGIECQLCSRAMLH